MWRDRGNRNSIGLIPLKRIHWANSRLYFVILQNLSKASKAPYRFKVPYPQERLGYSSLLLLSAPRIRSCLISRLLMVGQFPLTMPHSKISAAAPAVTEAAMLVPVMDTERFPGPIVFTSTPGAIRSGLILPLLVKPRLELI